jgi:DNA segregation ATPase FtsK/SpoIIIE, S-DNA-T family
MPKNNSLPPKPSAAPKKGSRPAAKAAPRANAKPESRPQRKAPARKGQGWSWGSISPERKLDILGIILALIGLLTLLSVISPSHGTVTGAWVELLNQVAGWGTFVLPLALLAIGLWLVFRNVEKLPTLSAVRLTGIVLVYLNLLAFMHLLAGGGQEMATAGQGGGYLGWLFVRLLVGSIGTAGAVVALIAWLLIALGLALDLSLVELFGPIIERMRRSWRERPARSAAALPGSSADFPERLVPPEPPMPNTLPPEFRPLSGARSGSVKPARQTNPNSIAVNPPAASEPAQPVTASAAQEESNIPPAVAPAGSGWAVPTTDVILDPAEVVFAQENLDHERAQIIEETLQAFGAPAHVVEVHKGPTVTQFGIEPDFIESRGQRTRVRVSKIVALTDDITLALAAQRIRIQAPVPGHNYVGIEVPNTEIVRVTLREIMESESFQKIKGSLRFAVGKDVSGRPVAYDLASMPHLLIAGTTGSGKSVCVNAILCCFLMNNSPADLRLVLVDPKRVELTGYNGIPHLLAPVITDAERVVGALQWMMREMDNRYRKFSRSGVRNIQEYNTRQSAEHLPYLVIVIDELADLMMLAPEETERSITRLAQLARATGIHMILATQRPSVDVVTGLIKANFPARIAFAVASQIDSRVILDQPGAERLLGRGDMLFQAPDASAPARLQGAYVTDSEIQRLVDYWRLAAAAAPSSPPAVGAPVDSLPAGVPLKQNPLWDLNAAEATDPLTDEAIDLIRKEGRASITMLQRRMRIGYTRAARLIDSLEQKGIIGPTQPNSQVREVLDYGPAGPPKDD